ncbi:MAG TPA: N-6 DNA methylase, partial [Egibacteraceae bacterium]|nr:N-6 DNA methylase [Egibacteraceae bacterium]
MVGDAALRAYLARVTAAAGDAPPAAVLGAVAGAVARVHGVALDPGAGLLQPTGEVDAPAFSPPEGVAAPELLGQVYESLRSTGARRSTGAFYTPEAVARPIVVAVLDGLPGQGEASRVLDGVPGCGEVPRVGDPSAGGGAFLLAAVRHLTARGGDPRVLVRDCVFGVDVDPIAVAVTRTALAIVAGGQPPPAAHVRVADALDDPQPLPAGLDAVVGNPPFLSQLAAATARSPAQRRALEARFGAPARGYADTAVLFLLLAMRLV